MKLVQFPGELLSLILSYSDVTSSPIELWKCGDTSLNRKMAMCVHTVDLKDLNPASTSRYPKMLSSLRNLRVLRIKRVAYIAPPLILSQELRKLPPTLEELELSIPSTQLNFFLDWPPTTSELDSCKHTRRKSPSIWNIGAFFPRLRRLVAGDEQRGQIDLEMLRGVLPSSLEYLEFGAVCSDIERVEGILPPSLRTFKMTTVPNAIDYPSSLTYLGEDFMLAGYVGVDLVKVLTNLPPGITKIPSLSIDYDYMREYLNATTIKPSLEYLSISFNSQFDHPIEWIPPALTVLLFEGLTLPVPLLRALPRTITELRADTIDFDGLRTSKDTLDEDTLGSLWPPNLTSWRFPDIFCDLDANSFVTQGDILKSLPSSIISLYASGIHGITRYDWDSQFPKLRSLHLFLLPNSFDLNGLAQKQDFLASCLRAQNLETLYFILADHYLDEVSAEFLFAALPRGLRTLDMNTPPSSTEWTSHAWSCLPPSLTHLRVEMDSHLPSPALTLPYLPQNLSRLWIKFLEAPTAEEVRSMPCYHSLRAIDFIVLKSADAQAWGNLEAWPEATRSHAGPIADRNKQYPDPRVIKRYQHQEAPSKPAI